MSLTRDLLIAKRLQKQFDEEAKIRKKSKNNNGQVALKPYQCQEIDLTDPKLEYIDPNPDIHALFIHFDNLFFWKKLRCVEVKWSPRMTSCAGICCYQGRGGLCSIRLSLPLLKLRPRKDLIETLLHEMIHAYLFVTHNNRDRDGHGPEFHKHMYRINKAAGTKITVYHTFHDEVRSYQQHWWKCQGPCQKRPPYFGMVRRAMNRPPGPSDFWWSDHQASCGGTYVKIREPEGFKAKTKGKGGKTTSKKGLTTSSKTEPPRLTEPKKIEKPSVYGIGGDAVKPTVKSGIYGYFIPSKTVSDQKTSPTVGGSLGNKSSQVSAVNSEGSKVSEISRAISKPFVPFSGKGQVLGGGNSAQRPTFPKQLLSGPKGSPSLKKDLGKRNDGTYNEVSPVKKPRIANIPSAIDSAATSSSSSSKPPVASLSGSGQKVKCPVCNTLQNEATINEHLDDCITGGGQSKSTDDDDDVICLDPPIPVSGDKELWYLECPSCHEKVLENEFDLHLNSCERICDDEPVPENESQEDPSSSSEDNVECPCCPICGQSLSGSALGAHLDACLSSMPFDDEEDNWS